MYCTLHIIDFIGAKAISFCSLTTFSVALGWYQWVFNVDPFELRINTVFSELGRFMGSFNFHM